MTEAAPILQVKDLRKSYGRAEALRGLTFDLRPAELVGLALVAVWNTTFPRWAPPWATAESGAG